MTWGYKNNILISEEPPSDEMLESIEKLVCLALKGNKYLKETYSALGHNQLDGFYNEYTCNCPGEAFYEEVSQEKLSGRIVKNNEPTCPYEDHTLSRS